MFDVPQWVIGTLICMFGSTLTALGLVLQKLSHVLKEDKEKHAAAVEKKEGQEPSQSNSYVFDPCWLLGFSVFLLAQVINMTAMAMTPQSVLSCLGSWTLVCNTVFAYLLLGEPIQRRTIAIGGGLLLSMALVVYSAPRPSGDEDAFRTFPVLTGRFASWTFLCLTSCFVALGCAAIHFARRQEEPKNELPTVTEEKSCHFHMPDPKASNAAVDLLLGGSSASHLWAIAAAMAAGYTALSFKCISLLVSGVALGATQMQWTFVLIVAGAITCAASDCHLLNVALTQGDAISVVPLYLSLSMLTQLILGGTFFQEFSHFSSGSHMVIFVGSVALLMCCVGALAQAPATDQTSGMEADLETCLGEASPMRDGLTPLRSSLVAAPSPAARFSERMTPRGTKLGGFGQAVSTVSARTPSRGVTRRARRTATALVGDNTPITVSGLKFGDLSTQLMDALTPKRNAGEAERVGFGTLTTSEYVQVV